MKRILILPVVMLLAAAGYAESTTLPPPAPTPIGPATAMSMVTILPQPAASFISMDVKQPSSLSRVEMGPPNGNFNSRIASTYGITAKVVRAGKIITAERLASKDSSGNAAPIDLSKYNASTPAKTLKVAVFAPKVIAVDGDTNLSPSNPPVIRAKTVYINGIKMDPPNDGGVFLSGSSFGSLPSGATCSGNSCGIGAKGVPSDTSNTVRKSIKVWQTSNPKLSEIHKALASEQGQSGLF